jgi:hypothetical protein
MSRARSGDGVDPRPRATAPPARDPSVPAVPQREAADARETVAARPRQGADAIRTWQRLAGNHAVSRILARPVDERGARSSSPGAVPVVQREDKNALVPVLVHFSTPLTAEQFVATTNAQLGIPGTTWRYVEDRYEASASPVRVLVRPSTLRGARSRATADEIGLTVDGDGAIAGTSARGEAFAKMPAGGEKQALFDEIDRRYSEVTRTPLGVKIKEEETGRRELWLQIQDEVLAQRAYVTALPAKVQLVITMRAGGVLVTPREYQQLVRVAAKIQALSEVDIQTFLSQGGGPAPSLDALEKSVSAFVDAKAAAPAQIAEAMTAAGEDAWKLDTLAAGLTAQAMSYLSLADRLTLVRKVAGGLLVGDEDERTLIRLLSSTPSADLKALTAALRSDGSALLKTLESVIDGAESKEYYGVLRSIVFGAMDPETALAQMQAAKIFPWADPGIFKAVYTTRFYYDTVEYTRDGKVRVKYWVNIGPMGMQTTEQVLEPDELIGLHFFLDEDFANAKRGETIYMPAAQLIAFKNEQFGREMHLAVDVGLLFAGGAGLLTKASRLAKAIAVLDTTIAAAALVISSFRTDIAKTDEGKAFLKAWDVTQTLIAAYGIAKLVVRLPETFRNLRAAYDAFRAKPTALAKDAMTTVEGEARTLFKRVDDAVFESELSHLRSTFSADELAAFEKQLARAGEITDVAKRQAAVAVIEQQITTQKANVALVAELRAANPTLKEGQIARLAASRITVPTVPHGMTLEEFTEAQALIKNWLATKGISGASGFATGSRVTGATFNPGKKAGFGKTITDFSGRDLDITLVTPTALTSSMQDELRRLYKARFGHELGIRPITDTRELAHIPVWGKIDLNLK